MAVSVGARQVGRNREGGRGSIHLLDILAVFLIRVEGLVFDVSALDGWMVS